MCDDTDLPDHDYASIYGPDALEARRTARFQQLLAHQGELERRLQALLAQMERRHPSRGDDPPCR